MIHLELADSSFTTDCAYLSKNCMLGTGRAPRARGSPSEMITLSRLPNTPVAGEISWCAHYCCPCNIRRFGNIGTDAQFTLHSMHRTLRRQRLTDRVLLLNTSLFHALLGVFKVLLWFESFVQGMVISAKFSKVIVSQHFRGFMGPRIHRTGLIWVLRYIFRGRHPVEGNKNQDRTFVKTAEQKLKKRLVGRDLLYGMQDITISEQAGKG